MRCDAIRNPTKRDLPRRGKPPTSDDDTSVAVGTNSEMAMPESGFPAR